VTAAAPHFFTYPFRIRSPRSSLAGTFVAPSGDGPIHVVPLVVEIGAIRERHVYLTVVRARGSPVVIA